MYIKLLFPFQQYLGSKNFHFIFKFIRPVKYNVKTSLNITSYWSDWHNFINNFADNKSKRLLSQFHCSAKIKRFFLWFIKLSVGLGMKSSCKQSWLIGLKTDMKDQITKNIVSNKDMIIYNQSNCYLVSYNQLIICAFDLKSGNQLAFQGFEMVLWGQNFWSFLK